MVDLPPSLKELLLPPAIVAGAVFPPAGAAAALLGHWVNEAAHRKMEEAIAAVHQRIQQLEQVALNFDFLDTLPGRDCAIRLYSAAYWSADEEKRTGCLAALLRLAQPTGARGEELNTLVGLIAELDSLDYWLVDMVVRLYDDAELERHARDHQYKLTEGDQLKGGVAYYRILRARLRQELEPGHASSMQGTEETALLNCHLLRLCDRFILDSQGMAAGWGGVGPTTAERIAEAWFAPTILGRKMARLVAVPGSDTP